MKQQIIHTMTDKEAAWLKSKIRDVPDFPKPGIIFKDLTTLFKDKEAFKYVIDVFFQHYAEKKPDYIAGIEARGFIVGAAVAYCLQVGFIPVRKPGKLPYKVFKESYSLEYGTNSLEVHQDAVSSGDKVVLIDDVLATGGTAAAALSLLQKMNAKVIGVGCLVELTFLQGRNKIPKDTEIFSMVEF